MNWTQWIMLTSLGLNIYLAFRCFELHKNFEALWEERGELIKRLVGIKPIVWNELLADPEIQEIAKNAKPWPRSDPKLNEMIERIKERDLKEFAARAEKHIEEWKPVIGEPNDEYGPLRDARKHDGGW